VRADQRGFWFDAPKGQKHGPIFSHINAVDREQGDLHLSNIAYAQLYSNRLEPGLGGSSNRGPVRAGDDGSVTENVIQSVIDTATSLIGKSRPKVTVLTEGADWDIQELAAQVEKYTWGLFQSLDVYDKMSLIFRDACVFGTGVLKIFNRKGKICIERVLIDEMIVDEQEVPSGGLPQQMHQVRYVSRRLLKGQYPKLADKIDAAQGMRRSDSRSSQVDPDMCLVAESYRLPAGPGDPGVHVISIETATLLEEVWTKEWYPYVFFDWSPPLTGFYGQGLAEALLGFQIRINELNDFINRCQDLIAVPRVFVDAGSKLMKIQINNEVGVIIPYVGKPPVFSTPQAVSAEVYRYKEQLKAAAFEFAGISKMAAQATRPEGIEAAVALRELSDNQSQRFSIQQQRFESAFMTVGRLLIECAKMLGKDAPKMYMSESYVEEIEWPAIDFDKLRFVLHVSPSSIMSMTPAGRLQKVIELAQYGVPLPPEVMTKLLGHPDLGLEDKRRTSALDDAEWLVSRLKRGEYFAPEGFQNLNLCIERVTSAYLDGRRTKQQPDRLAMMRQWVKAAQEELRKTAPPPMDPTAMMQPGAPAPGMPTPGMPPGAMPPPPIGAALDAGALPGVVYAPPM
jgi:hypothetical protein